MMSGDEFGKNGELFGHDADSSTLADRTAAHHAGVKSSVNVLNVRSARQVAKVRPFALALSLVNTRRVLRPSSTLRICRTQ